MGEEKKGFFAKLKAGLAKTRNNIVHGIDQVFSGYSDIDVACGAAGVVQQRQQQSGGRRDGGAGSF